MSNQQLSTKAGQHQPNPITGLGQQTCLVYAFLANSARLFDDWLRESVSKT